MEVSKMANFEIARINAEFNNNIKGLNSKTAQKDFKKIDKLSKDFESIFLEIMLKSMRDTVPKSGLLDGGNGEDIFRSMLDAEYAKQIASQDTSGIAHIIKKQLINAYKNQHGELKLKK